MYSARLENAGVRFRNGPWVFQGLDFSVHRDEFVSIVGPSGCGKSTVLRVLAGLQGLSEGRLNRPVREVAFVFQEPALLPWASLEDNVALPLRLAGEPASQRSSRARAVIAQVGLAGREEALPHELSGGMKMRASIARAWVMEPDLLLMDEPFAALDDPTRQRLQTDLLQTWAASRVPVCFVTHQVAEAVFMSTRVVVMGRGAATAARTLTIDAPYPRTEAFRRSAEFHALCVAVGDALQEAQGAGTSS